MYHRYLATERLVKKNKYIKSLTNQIIENYFIRCGITTGPTAGAVLYSFNDYEVYNDIDIKSIISKATKPYITIFVIPPTPTDIHPDTGLPQLNSDQFVHLASCYQQIINDETIYIPDNDIDQPQNINVVNQMNAQNFTRKQLMNQENWKEWEASEWLQLDQYERQNMFSKPGLIPTDIQDYSILPMIWVYLIKTDGRKMARCIKNKVFLGSDAVNTFAKAPPPKSALFLKVDVAYKSWYKNKNGVSLSDNTYVRVLQAIQGHPESPRLWNLHIDSILSKMGYTPTTHEPCIYIEYTPTETIYLLRQVDDFAVACNDKSTATNC